MRTVPAVVESGCCGPAEIRQAVADSFPVGGYEPRIRPGNNEAAARLQNFLE